MAHKKRVICHSKPKIPFKFHRNNPAKPEKYFFDKLEPEIISYPKPTENQKDGKLMPTCQAIRKVFYKLMYNPNFIFLEEKLIYMYFQ